MSPCPRSDTVTLMLLHSPPPPPTTTTINAEGAVLLINATDCWSTAKVKFERIAKEYFPTASYGWIFLYF
jgi:hypothetical protein